MSVILINKILGRRRTMDKYTYKNIIINPNSEEAMACIGKEIYFHDSPNACLYYANTGNNAQCGILRKIKIDSFCPFVVAKMVVGIGDVSYLKKKNQSLIMFLSQIKKSFYLLTKSIQIV